MQQIEYELRIEDKERKRLYFQRAANNGHFAASALSMLALGFVLRLIEAANPSLDGNVRFFLRAAFPFLCGIASIFLLIFYIRIAACRIPKPAERICLIIGASSQVLRLTIASKKRQTTMEVRKVSFDRSKGWLLVGGGFRQVMIPLSSVEPSFIIQCLHQAPNEGPSINKNF